MADARPLWTEDQVASLNGYQGCGWYHPFTCACRAVLVAEPSGWRCPNGCGYTQDWAHAHMADWSWREGDPFERLASEENPS